MTTIGSFIKTIEGCTGSLDTPTLNARVKKIAVPKDGDKAPDYLVHAGAIEIGGAWKRQSAAKRVRFGPDG